MQPKNALAHAYDVETREVYQPIEKPGYACWVCLWRSTSGELLMAFTEKRRAPNPSFRPIPLDFWQAMALPVKYHVSFCNGDPNILTECVILESKDEGKSWVETGRQDVSGIMNIFALSSCENDDLIRAVDNSYLAFTRDYKPSTRIQKSTDSGKSWHDTAYLLIDNYQGYPYRLRRLHDGTLVLICPFCDGFGPGQPRQERHTIRPDVIAECQVGCWISTDDAQTWIGPMILLPGIPAEEPDFVELPSGDLLILHPPINQYTTGVRQYIRRTRTGYIPGPVYKVISGTIPETVCATKSGLLVGGTRCGAYSCSNDEGATWHDIFGLPDCNYQPQIIELQDGRFLCAWHKSDEGHGGDHFFGEDHQFVGEHIFRLDTSGLPEPTNLNLFRCMNELQTRFTNSFMASLTSRGKPVADKPVRFRVHKCYPFTPADKPEDVLRTTDADGNALLNVSDIFKDIDETVDIFRDCYYVQAFYDSSEGDAAARAESPMVRVYPMTAEKAKAHHYPLFVFEGKVFVTPDVSKEFPEIDDFVKLLKDKKTFTESELKQLDDLSDVRLSELTDFLIANHLLKRVDATTFEWRAELYSDGGVRVLEIEDYFE